MSILINALQINSFASKITTNKIGFSLQNIIDEENILTTYSLTMPMPSCCL